MQKLNICELNKISGGETLYYAKRPPIDYAVGIELKNATNASYFVSVYCGNSENSIGISSVLNGPQRAVCNVNEAMNIIYGDAWWTYLKFYKVSRENVWSPL